MSMLGLIIMRNHYLTININFEEERESLRDNINSAVCILEEDSNLLEYDKEQAIFEGSRIKVTVSKQIWGMLDLVKIKARGRVFCDSVMMLSTGMKAKEDSTALWITDKRNYISIGGEALLKGKCYIPRLGVRKGYVEKRSYGRDKVIYGEVKRSKSHLPALFKDISQRYTEAYKYEEVSELESLELENKFSAKTVVIYSSEDIDLTGIKLTDNIKVISEQRILVDSTSRLDKVILCAPEVFLGEGFRGNLQAFVGCRMTVGEGVHMEYPSYVFMKSRVGNVEIHIEEGADICGAVILYGNDESVLRSTSESVIKGQVYVKGRSSLQGKIYGSAYLDKLFFNTRWSKYEDIFYNTEIDRTRLENEMPVLNLFGDSQKQILVEWVN